MLHIQKHPTNRTSLLCVLKRTTHILLETAATMVRHLEDGMHSHSQGDEYTISLPDEDKAKPISITVEDQLGSHERYSIHRRSLKSNC